MASYELKWIRSDLATLYAQKAELEKRLIELDTPNITVPDLFQYTLTEKVVVSDLYKERDELLAMIERLQ